MSRCQQDIARKPNKNSVTPFGEIKFWYLILFYWLYQKNVFFRDRSVFKINDDMFFWSVGIPLLEREKI